MRVEGLHLLAELCEVAEPAALWETYYQHRAPDGHLVAMVAGRVPRDSIPRPTPGDTLVITVPAGTLSVTVVSERTMRRDTGELVRELQLVGTWEGSYYGLCRGESGVLRWKLDRHLAGTVVRSSTSSETGPVPLREFIAARQLASRKLFRDPLLCP